MNNILASFLTVVISLFLTGCISISQHYTPSTKLEKNLSSNKYDISYSLSYIVDGTEIIGQASEPQLRKIIEEKLMQSGYFSSVTYKLPNEKSRYHIYFNAHYSACTEAENMEHALLVGYTLCVIPSWQNSYLDLSAILTYDNMKIYSISTSENMRCFIWLPLVPFGLIWNDWLAWRTQEKKCINYLLNNITNFQENYFKQ